MRQSTPHPDCRPALAKFGAWRQRAWAVVLLLVGFMLAPALSSAQEADLGFSPASGHARVVAQGVAEIPAGDVVWRTVRTRAQLPADAPFEARSLGFVMATGGPIVLVDADTGAQIQLGLGEAAMVPSGVVQQRASLGAQPVSYLSIELVAEDAAPPSDNAQVLQPGPPFASPGGLHDLDLVSDLLAGGESLTIPDSGSKNVILITRGAAVVGKPGGNTVGLLAGEAATFSGELVVAPDPSGGAVSLAEFVVAMIGPEMPQPTLPTSPGTADAAVTPDTASSGTGSIAVEVFGCPPGMTLDTFNAAACSPVESEFDVTLSGAGIPEPLTTGDATRSGEAVRWADLPFGEYVLAEAILPDGYADYAMAARGAAGNSTLGYRVTIDASNPDLVARIFNFAAP